jgi:hypothetical protein
MNMKFYAFINRVEEELPHCKKLLLKTWTLPTTEQFFKA